MRNFSVCLPLVMLVACADSRRPTALNEHPTLRVAEAAMASGSPEIAVNVARDILARDAYDIPAQLTLGDAFYQLKLYPEGEAAFNVVLKLRPEDATAHLGLGRIKLAEQDPRAAEEQFRRAIQQQPRPETLSNLGVALDLQHRTTEAQAEYRRALQLDPDSEATRLNLSLSLLASGDTAGARAALPAEGGSTNEILAPSIAVTRRAIASQSLGAPAVPATMKPGVPHAPD